jgi:hypothetical protein
MALSTHLSPPKRPGLRRLSSMTATEKDVQAGGPVVVVPERMMAQRSQSYHGPTFASAMETARKELARLNLEEEAVSSPSESSPEIPGTPVTPGECSTTDSFAFAFDIDGVLIRGGRPIPEAIEAMKVLNGENEYGVRMYVRKNADMTSF